MALFQRLMHPYTSVSLCIFGFYLLLWGAQWLFPGSAAGSAGLVLAALPE